MAMQRIIDHCFPYRTEAKALDELEAETHLFPTWLFLILILGLTLFLVVSFFIL